MYKTHAGDYCEGVIPDPIPNSVLCLKTRKSRTLPAIKNIL